MRIRLASAAVAGLLVLAPTSAMADAGAQESTAAVMTSAAESNDDDGDRGMWGLLGLLGLAGLAGLKKRKDPEPRYNDRVDPAR